MFHKRSAIPIALYTSTDEYCVVGAFSRITLYFSVYNMPRSHFHSRSPFRNVGRQNNGIVAGSRSGCELALDGGDYMHLLDQVSRSQTWVKMETIPITIKLFLILSTTKLLEIALQTMSQKIREI